MIWYNMIRWYDIIWYFGFLFQSLQRSCSPPLSNTIIWLLSINGKEGNEVVSRESSGQTPDDRLSYSMYYMIRYDIMRILSYQYDILLRREAWYLTDWLVLINWPIEKKAWFTLAYLSLYLFPLTCNNAKDINRQ